MRIRRHHRIHERHAHAPRLEEELATLQRPRLFRRLTTTNHGRTDRDEILT